MDHLTLAGFPVQDPNRSHPPDMRPQGFGLQQFSLGGSRLPAQCSCHHKQLRGTVSAQRSVHPPQLLPAQGWRAPGPVLPSARRRDACTKDGSRLSFSAISSGKYFSSPIARTSDRAWPGANPARSDAAVPGSRGDRPSARQRSSRAWGCAARAGTCFSRAPAPLQSRPQLERLPARPAPAGLSLEAEPGGRGARGGGRPSLGGAARRVA